MLPAASVAAGLWMLWQAMTTPPEQSGVARARRLIGGWLTGNASPKGSLVVVLTLLAAGTVAWSAHDAFGEPVRTVAAGLLAGAVPGALAHRRHRNHQRERRQAWPDAVDHLASAVRAGASPPEAWSQLARLGPPVLRDDIAALAQPGATCEHWLDSLSDLARRSAGDASMIRVVEGLRLAHEANGTARESTLSLLRTLLRADLTARSRRPARARCLEHGRSS